MDRVTRAPGAATAGLAAFALAACATLAGVGKPVAEDLRRFGGHWERDGQASRALGSSSLRFRTPDTPSGWRWQSQLGAEIEVSAMELTLAFTDSLFTLSAIPVEASLTVPANGDWALDDGHRARMFRRRGALMVERRWTYGDAWLIDRYELRDDGKLLVVRTAGFGRDSADGALQRVYVRSADGSR